MFVFFSLFSFTFVAAALTEFSPERKKKQETPRKQESKKKQASVKKMLRTRPAKYYYLIPPNTPETMRHELEQRQRPVRSSFVLYQLSFVVL